MYMYLYTNNLSLSPKSVLDDEIYVSIRDILALTEREGKRKGGERRIDERREGKREI